MKNYKKFIKFSTIILQIEFIIIQREKLYLSYILLLINCSRFWPIRGIVQDHRGHSSTSSFYTSYVHRRELSSSRMSSSSFSSLLIFDSPNLWMPVKNKLASLSLSNLAGLVVSAILSIIIL